MRFLKFFCFFILCHQSMFAYLTIDDFEESSESCISQDYIHSKHSKSKSCKKKCRGNSCQLGLSGHAGGPNFFYPIEVPIFPQTTLLSLDRTLGFVEGDIELTPTGLKIGRTGSYAVTFTVIVRNPTPNSHSVFSVFLILNDQFDPNNTQTVSNTTTVFGGDNPSDFVLTSIVGNGILKNVPCGTTLSLVASNGGDNILDPLTVIGWDITAYRIAGCP